MIALNACLGSSCCYLAEDKANALSMNLVSGQAALFIDIAFVAIIGVLIATCAFSTPLIIFLAIVAIPSLLGIIGHILMIPVCSICSCLNFFNA